MSHSPPWGFAKTVFMINFLFQGLAVGLKSLLVFALFYMVKTKLDAVEASYIILNFSAAVVASVLLSFGQDQVFILKKSIKVPYSIMYIRFCWMLLLSVGFFLGWIPFAFILTTFGLMFLLEIKSCAKYSMKHKWDAIANLLALLLFILFSYYTDDYATAFGISVFFGALPVWLNMIEISRDIHFNFRFYFQFLISGLLFYSFLNIDWIFFKYLGNSVEFTDYALAQKIALNLSLIATIMGSVVIGWTSAINNKRVIIYYFLGGTVALLIYLLVPYFLLRIFMVGDGTLSGIYLWFLVLLLLRFVLSWAELPLKREGSPLIRIYTASAILMMYLAIGMFLFRLSGAVGLVQAMIGVHVLYITFLFLYNYKFKLWNRTYE